MKTRNALLSTIAVLAIAALSAATSAGAATYSPIKRLGTATLGAISSSSGAIAEGSLETFEFPEFDFVNREIPHSGLSAARVPASHVPSPAGNPVASANPGFVGFNGLSHFDQRFAGTGIYTNTQFSLEPPDQALCVGNGRVLESVNTALRVFTTNGTAVTGAIPLNQFFNLKPEIDRVNVVFGDFTSDPKCHYDAATDRFFLTLLRLGVNPANGAFTGASNILLAVSQSGDPAGAWSLYSIDTANDGSNGTPTHTACPCFGDQPLIGADANGFYISTNEFPIFAGGFNGAQIYAISKTALAANPATLPAVQTINAGAIAAPDGGIWYTVQPATTPPGGTYAGASGGTEYLMSALDFSGTLDNRIAVWALTNTSSLDTATPSLALSNAIVASEVYGQPPDAQQRPGPTPLGDSLSSHSPKEKLELIAGNDDRMNQVVYTNGKLWGAVNTVVKTQNGPTRVGIAYFAVAPSVSGAVVSGTMAAQGYVAVNQQNVMYPSIGINSAGRGAMVFTLVGPDVYPSAAYVTLDDVHGAGAVHIAGAGAGPEDGFTGYKGEGADGRTARWGDYSAAAVDANGDIWLATEYIPGGARSVLANWGTFISRVTP